MIHHVNFVVAPEQADECVEFYKILGFAQVDPPDELRDRSVWLESRGCQIHIEPRAGTPVKPIDDSEPPAGHIAVVVPDFDIAVGALNRTGFNIRERKQYWGSPRVMVHDPAGNLVEIMESPPTASG